MHAGRKNCIRLESAVNPLQYKMEDMANRMAKGGKGAGMGLGLMGALGAAAIGLYQSIYTGMRTIFLYHSLQSLSSLSVSVSPSQGVKCKSLLLLGQPLLSVTNIYYKSFRITSLLS